MTRGDRQFIAFLAAECEEHLGYAAALRLHGCVWEAEFSEELARRAAEQALRVAEASA